MTSVYDIETYPNFFCCSFKDIETKEVRSFRVSETVDEWYEFAAFYLSHTELIGYNNVDFDCRVLQPFLEDPSTIEYFATLENILKIDALYRRAAEVTAEDFKESRRKPLIPQRDLFRIYHFNNKAKMVSLKYLEMNIGHRDVRETPVDFREKVAPEMEEEVLAYNVNDIEATYSLYLLSLSKIRLRKTIGEKYNADLRNAPDNKIGETIFLKELVRLTGRTEKAIKEGRTFRASLALRECIVDGVRFETTELNNIHNAFKGMVIRDTKKEKEMSVYMDNVKYDFGFGGLHALRAPGLYTNIHSADVSSYYANLSIVYTMYPQHLGPAFCKVYKHIYDERMKSEKGSDENTAYKAALVCVFGASNTEWSFFCDRKLTMTITVSGQLLLAMLCERITTSGAGHIVMANTDGIETQVENEEVYNRVCGEWQKETGLLLEFNQYKQIAIRDVNNYHAVTFNGKVKQKGDFVVDKEMHKDQSHKIVTIAVDAFFTSNILPEKTIKECNDISVFLLCKRARKGKVEYRTAKEAGLQTVKLGKNNRYYISRSGGSLVKITKLTAAQIEVKKNRERETKQLSMFDIPKPKEGTETKVAAFHKGYRATLFNQWVDKPFAEYNVEHQFYIREAYKLINSVIQNQTSI